MEFVITFVVPVVASYVSTMGFALLYNIHGKNIHIASVCGAFSYAVYLVVMQFTDSVIVPNFLGGVAIAIYAELAAMIFKAPITVYLVPGIVPLVPGLTIYKAMEACLRGNLAVGGAGVVNTIKIGGAIALGLILTSYFFRLFRSIAQKLGRDAVCRQ